MSPRFYIAATGFTTFVVGVLTIHKFLRQV